MEMEFREELRSISEELNNLIGTIVKPIGSDPMLGANPKRTRAPLPTRDVGSWAQQREKVCRALDCIPTESKAGCEKVDRR